jgi:hypothetical protein
VFVGSDASGLPTGCTPNHANAEIPGNGCDDDGNGSVDDVTTCDSTTSLSGTGAAGDFAKAIGLCDSASSRGFGVVTASYSKGYGMTDAPHAGQWGILPKYGDVIKPREGVALGALSSGYAREFDAADGNPWTFNPGTALNGTNYPNGAAPPGFPKAAQGCAQDNKVNPGQVHTEFADALSNAQQPDDDSAMRSGDRGARGNLLRGDRFHLRPGQPAKEGRVDGVALDASAGRPR